VSAGDRAAAWIYRGIWRAIVDWFRVPEAPPRLPDVGEAADRVDAFKPAPAFLKYLKVYFWIGLVLIDAMILVPWVVLMVNRPTIGMLVAPVAWFIAIVPDVLVYIALHLRYDSTWYLLSDRSMRIRRGIWIIRETTITYENVQNVTVHQGPVQRFFGISNVVVRTAGGGGGKHGHGHEATHLGVVEGIADADQVRDRIMARVRRSRTAGLGDEQSLAGSDGHAREWTVEHVRVLREVRDLVSGLSAARRA
jgi:membrane protein YdbS with pleckstrin-like domain